MNNGFIKNLTTLIGILSFIFLLLACDDEQSEVKKPGKVKLSINTVGNASGRANSDNLDKIKKIVVSIETAAGTSVHDLHTLELVRFNNSFVSEELELEPGTYKVTKFFVTDADKNVLYATPLENSDLASLVADPLPVSFVINADGSTTEVFMEAVNVEETLPEDFGYVTFALGLIDYKSFEVSATIAVENHTGSVNGTFEAFAKNAQGQITWSKSWDIAQKINITIPVAARYSFKLSKAGYLPHEQHYNFEIMKYASQLNFELMPKGSDDFIVKHFPGKATVYFPVDKGKLYTRVDLEEDYAFTNVDFVDVDRYVTNINADHPSAYLYATVTYVNYVPEDEQGHQVFVNRSINLFDNKPFADTYDLRNVPFTLTPSHFFEEFDRDATVDSQIFLYEIKDDYNFYYDAHYQVWSLKQDFLTYWCDKSPDDCDELTEKFDAYNSQNNTTPAPSKQRKSLQNHNVAR